MASLNKNTEMMEVDNPQPSSGAVVLGDDDGGVNKKSNHHPHHHHHQQQQQQQQHTTGEMQLFPLQPTTTMMQQYSQPYLTPMQQYGYNAHQMQMQMQQYQYQHQQQQPFAQLQPYEYHHHQQQQQLFHQHHPHNNHFYQHQQHQNPTTTMMVQQSNSSSHQPQKQQPMMVASAAPAHNMMMHQDTVTPISSAAASSSSSKSNNLGQNIEIQKSTKNSKVVSVDDTPKPQKDTNSNSTTTSTTSSRTSPTTTNDGTSRTLTLLQERISLSSRFPTVTPKTVDSHKQQQKTNGNYHSSQESNSSSYHRKETDNTSTHKNNNTGRSQTTNFQREGTNLDSYVSKYVTSPLPAVAKDDDSSSSSSSNNNNNNKGMRNINTTVASSVTATSSTISNTTAATTTTKTTSRNSNSNNDENTINNNNAASGKEQPQQPRRSGRERTSTLIYVDGHAIKKDNNYVMKGLRYEYGVVPEGRAGGDEEQHQNKKKAAAMAPTSSSSSSSHSSNGNVVVANKKATTTTKAAASTPKPPSEAEINRRKMKDSITKRIQEKQSDRQAFLKQNVQHLEPFLESKVLERIQSFQQQEETNQYQSYYQQPKAIKGEMRDYQLKGLNWMSNMYSKNLGFILGDEMGLGKTLQTISLVCHLKEQFGVTSGPSLIVCPLSVLYSWCNEIQKWSNLTYFRLHTTNTGGGADSNKKNNILPPDLGKYDMIVTTYEMCKSPILSHTLWSRQHFNLVVLDEGHRIKGLESQISHAVRKIHCENRVILTGTPLANNLIELYALLSFLLPDVFTTVEPFANAYDLTKNQVNKEMLDAANKVLNLFMIRRLKTLVEKKMPKKVETKVICPLSNTQIWWYKSLLLKDLRLLTGGTEEEGSANGGGGGKKAGALNNLIMQLRKCVNHPYNFPFAEDYKDEATLEELVGESGKLAVLDMLLCSLYKKGHRVCLFSQFTKMLDILDDYARMRGWNYCRFDGGTARAERNYVVNSFNQKNSQKFLFLMSTRSGGMGLNLQTADTVILYDSDWNPQADIQAEARVHRIGQTKTVFVYRMVTANTVEERIAERAEKKMFMAKKIMKDGSADTSKDADDTEDAGQFLDALKFGCNAVFGDSAQTKMTLPTDEDIEQLTDRTRTDGSCGKIKGGTETTAKDFDATKEYTATTNFGGIDFKKLREDYQKKRKPKDLGAICDIWRKQKRERKSRITLVDGSGSGYGGAIPVLKSNDYDLESGERSVFQQELGNRKGGNFKNEKKQHLKAGVDFESQDMCQVCGDGGLLLCCPRCPVAVHPACAQCTEKNFLQCSHHNCIVCGRNTSDSGGFLFRCSCCPRAFCEDHLPATARQLDHCERIEGLGFHIKHGIYVHCSPICENVAIQEFDWVPPDEQKKAPCPPPLELTKYFGGQVDDCLEKPDDLVINTKRRRKQPTKYGDFAQPEPVMVAQASKSNVAATTTPVAVSDVASGASPRVSSTSSGASSASSVATSKSFESSYSSESVHSTSDESLVLEEPTPKKSKPKAIASTKSATVLDRDQGEYSAFIPMVSNSLNLRLGQIGNNVVFLGYKQFEDGTKSLAEMRGAFKSENDRILSVNGVCTQQSSLKAVMNLIQSIKEKGTKVFHFGMQEYATWSKATSFAATTPAVVAGVAPVPVPPAGILSAVPTTSALMVTSSAPSVPASKSLGSSGTSDEEKSKPKALTNGKSTTKKDTGEYTAVVQLDINGSLNLNIEKRGNNVVFTGYSQLKDGTKSFGETHRAIRGEGDRIIAVNGISCRHSSFEAVVQLIQSFKDKGNRVFHLGMQEYVAWAEGGPAITMNT